MKKLMLAILVCHAVIFTSCNKDFTTAEITYTKATAIYGDLSELRNLPLQGEVRELLNPGKIYVSEELLLIGEEKEGIHVYDNADPENPRAISFIQIPKNKEFYVEGNTIYAESHYDMLKIDISNKQSPRLLNRIENAFANDLKNENGESVVDFEFKVITEEIQEDTPIWNIITNNETVFLDFNNRLIPNSAVPSSFAGSSGSSIGTVNRIAVLNDYVYVIGYQAITVFKDEQELEFRSTNQIGWRMETIYPQQNALFVGTQTDMQILDISNPEAPDPVGWFAHGRACDPVLPVGDIAYVTLRTGDEMNCPGDENALVVVNTSNLRNPFQVQEIVMESPYGMTLIGDKLYVGEGASGLKIFDATDRDNIIEIKHDTSVQAYDIIAHPFRQDLILIASPNGFGQYEIDAATEDLSLLSWISH